MKFYRETADLSIMLEPETVEECGLLQWLAKRFEGQAVTLKFDTSNTDEAPTEPFMWVKAVK